MHCVMPDTSMHEHMSPPLTEVLCYSALNTATHFKYASSLALGLSRVLSAGHHCILLSS